MHLNEKGHLLGRDRYLDRRHEMGTIVGSREVKHVELEVGLNTEGLSMIGWLRHLSRPDANRARIAN